MSAVIEEKPTVQPYRDYSIEFKAEALARVKANDGNVLRTANELGIPHQSIRNWLESEERFSHLSKQKQIDLAQKHENNLHRLADSITETDLETVPFIQKVTAIGILTDKMQLLRGQPTSITQSIERTELVAILSTALGDVIDTEAMVSDVSE